MENEVKLTRFSKFWLLSSEKNEFWKFCLNNKFMNSIYNCDLFFLFFFFFFNSKGLSPDFLERSWIQNCKKTTFISGCGLFHTGQSHSTYWQRLLWQFKFMPPLLEFQTNDGIFKCKTLKPFWGSAGNQIWLVVKDKIHWASFKHWWYRSEVLSKSNIYSSASQLVWDQNPPSPLNNQNWGNISTSQMYLMRRWCSLNLI